MTPRGRHGAVRSLYLPHTPAAPPQPLQIPTVSLRIGHWVRRFRLADGGAHFAGNLQMLLTARPRVDFRLFLEEEMRNPADEGRQSSGRLIGCAELRALKEGPLAKCRLRL